MLTGVIKGTLLCCEGDNSTWNGVIDTTEDITEETSSLLRILHRIVIPIILSIGIFGNIIILTVLSGPMFRSIAYLYLSGLALAHIGVLVSWIPISVRLGYGIRNDYPSAFYHAHLELVTLNTFAAAGTLIMTCLIVDRYIFVFFPARIRSGNARKNVRSFILSSFILGFSVVFHGIKEDTLFFVQITIHFLVILSLQTSAPLAGMRMVYEEQSETGTLFTLRENTFVTQNALWKTYIWTMEIIVRICPTIVFILLNTLVVKRFLQLNAKKKEFQSVSEKFRAANAVDVSLLTRNRGYREEQHLVILTSVMVVCFFVTMIPSILLSILHQNYHATDKSYKLFRTFSAIAELCSFAAQIFMYLSCSEEFREEFLKILRGKCNESIDQDDQPVGEIEDFSRHGTTVRLTPEHTKLHSPGSPNKLNTMDEDKESELLTAVDAV